MDIEKLMVEAPDLASELAFRVMTRKPDGSLSIRKTSEGFDVGESYALHGLRLSERLAERPDGASASHWQETVTWYREHANFVLHLVMRVDAFESKKAAQSANAIEARLEQLQAENEALHEALDEAHTQRSGSHSQRLAELLDSPPPESSINQDRLRSLQRQVEELESRREAYRSAADGSRASPFLTVAGGAAAGWLLGKALTTPTEQ